ncbi:MAG: sigma-70 family RNA polymerase sigma factor [Lachnospiraceae bacterium]|nr:sigma-70 family RNA polymerase sigma factor [Lachnospiraceae bacterium]
MEDKQILDLYWTRSENAISETANKYGRYCHYIAFNILHNDEDSEECTNDTYLKAWETMPPNRPDKLSAFLGKITRNLALDKYRLYNTQKRGAGQISFVLDELQECIPTANNTEHIVDDLMLTQVLNQFLASLSETKRKIFMRRYWYLSTVKEISQDFNISESKVKMSLLRSRKKLKILLEKEGIAI